MGQLYRQISDTRQTASTIKDELVLLRSDLSGKPKTASDEPRAIVKACANNRGKSTASRVLMKQSIVFRPYTSMFGKLLLRKASQSVLCTGDEPQSTEVVSWIFMPSFLSRVVEYQFLSTCGFAQRVLRIYPIIPEDHPIWLMCRSGDLKGIQTLLSQRQVSPFSVNANGCTLLHVSSNYLVLPSKIAKN
jgi:hypothetical protein